MTASANTGSNPKQTYELELASRLLGALGYDHVPIQSSDRPDVLAQIGEARTGIEVTQFHADEGGIPESVSPRVKEAHPVGAVDWR